MQLRDLLREAVEYERKQRGITEDQFAVMLEERILSAPSTLYAVERFYDLVDKELNGASKYSEEDDQ